MTSNCSTFTWRFYSNVRSEYLFHLWIYRNETQTGDESHLSWGSNINTHICVRRLFICTQKRLTHTHTHTHTQQWVIHTWEGVGSQKCLRSDVTYTGALDPNLDLSVFPDMPPPPLSRYLFLSLFTQTHHHVTLFTPVSLWRLRPLRRCRSFSCKA